MARSLERLTALQVRRIDSPGLHADGGGLYLQLKGEAGRSWVFRYRNGKQIKCMGLGPVHSVSLSAARELAGKARELRAAGLDPLEERRKAEAVQVQEDAATVTFDAAVDAYIEDNKADWGNDKHRQQW